MKIKVGDKFKIVGGTIYGLFEGSIITIKRIDNDHLYFKEFKHPIDFLWDFRIKGHRAFTARNNGSYIIPVKEKHPLIVTEKGW